jgi:hypothetical protein
MDLNAWLLGMLFLGLGAIALMFVFVIACDKV